LHASFFKHSTSSTSINAPPNQPFSKSQHHLLSMGPSKCNFLLKKKFRHSLAFKNSCFLYVQTFWFPYVIISSLPFDFKLVYSIHKKCKHLQSLLCLIIILGAFWNLPFFFPLSPPCLMFFTIPCIFYCISCFQQTRGSHLCFFILCR